MGDESPKNKVKFLCSYGGKVLPRPSDGLLRYVGGETRVVSVPRHINFSELMKKVSSMVEGEMVLKYQLLPEDLDALVSVRTDEDVKHMIEEHDRHQNGLGLLRAFLFPPSKPGLVASEPYLLEQRYIDAINGIIRTSPRATKTSACSSPKSSSPDYSPRFVNVNVNAMQRVRSSPSLTNLDHVTHQQQQQHQHHHHHHHPFYPWPSTSPSSSTSTSTSRPPQDPQLGRHGGKGAAFNNYYHPNPRHRGAGYGYQDDSSYAHVPVTVSRNPRTKSIWGE